LDKWVIRLVRHQSYNGCLTKQMSERRNVGHSGYWSGRCRTKHRTRRASDVRGTNKCYFPVSLLSIHDYLTLSCTNFTIVVQNREHIVLRALSISPPPVMRQHSKGHRSTASFIIPTTAKPRHANQKTRKRTNKALCDPGPSFSDPADFSSDAEPFNEDDMYEDLVSGSDHGVETISRRSGQQKKMKPLQLPTDQMVCA
jgi:hypothetical protein